MKTSIAGAARLRRAARKKYRSRAEIEPLLPKVKRAIENLYGDRLVDIILYGSFARGKATVDSDIDIAVVLKGSVQRIKEITRIGDAIYPIGLEHEELISVYPLSEEELQNKVWPLYYYIRKEGVII